MKLDFATYKGMSAVRVTTRLFKALFLPSQGSKLVSLQDRESGFEWLAQARGTEYRELTMDGCYVDSECSAFDDMFPTIDPYTPKCGSRKGLSYNDHGEVCRLPFETETASDRLIMRAASERLRYDYTKTVTESPSGGLRMHYSIKNLSSDDFECLWAGHIMIAACEGGRIIVPFKKNAEAELMFGKKAELGSPGTKFGVLEGSFTSRAFCPDGESYKYYFSSPVPQGYCGYYNVQNKHTLMVSYDREKLPYLGIWINDGSFHSLHSIALEPCTAAFDQCDEAQRHGCPAVIPSRETLAFDLAIDLAKGAPEADW